MRKSAIPLQYQDLDVQSILFGRKTIRLQCGMKLVLHEYRLENWPDLWHHLVYP